MRLLAAFRSEINRDPERYKDDQVSIIVICHTKDAVGMTRARRLFTTVNRYAKKTSPATHTAMSEDDGVAVTTRRLVRIHPFFKLRVKVLVTGRDGKVKIASGNAMSASEEKYLMAIETFRKCNKKLMPADLEKEFSKEQQLPKFESLETAFEKISNRWNTIIEGVEAWKALENSACPVTNFRTSAGGHVLARPIGITAFVGAYSTAADTLSSEDIKRVVGQFSEISSAPWKGVLWNAAKGKMIVTVEAEKLAFRLWRYLLGLNENKENLEHDWKAAIDPLHELTDLRLPIPRD